MDEFQCRGNHSLALGTKNWDATERIKQFEELYKKVFTPYPQNKWPDRIGLPRLLRHNVQYMAEPLKSAFLEAFREDLLLGERCPDQKDR